MMAGVPELLCEELPPTLLGAKAQKGTIELPQPILRKNFSFILRRPCFATGVQMPRW
jgi:hypothetical protein